MRADQRLPNGIRVLSEELPDLGVGHGRASGSRTARATRRAEQAGISHFLEHLFFKGTERRTAAQIAEEIDAVGGVLNAFTGKEYTCYYAKVLARAPAARARRARATSSCTRASPRRRSSASARSILQEISQVEDTPDDYVHDLFDLAFWPGHPLSRPIAGSARDRRALQRDALPRASWRRATGRTASSSRRPGGVRHDAAGRRSASARSAGSRARRLPVDGDAAGAARGRRRCTRRPSSRCTSASGRRASPQADPRSLRGARAQPRRSAAA